MAFIAIYNMVQFRIHNVVVDCGRTGYKDWNGWWNVGLLLALLHCIVASVDSWLCLVDELRSQGWLTGNLYRGTLWAFDFILVAHHLGEELVRGLLGVAVTSPDMVLQPVRSFVRLLADGAGRARAVHAVLVPDVS